MRLQDIFTPTLAALFGHPKQPEPIIIPLRLTLSDLPLVASSEAAPGIVDCMAVAYGLTDIQEVLKNVHHKPRLWRGGARPCVMWDVT
jgi:hypothetical protein